MNKTYTIETKNAIALCHILGKYDIIEKVLKSSVSSDKRGKIVLQLTDILCDHSNHRMSLAYKIYDNYKEIFDNIAEYAENGTFIRSFFNKEENEAFHYYLRYFLDNSKNIDNILEILEKLYELDFENINLNEDLIFTRGIYTIPNCNGISYLIYLANLEVLPSYGRNITYRSIKSNYIMDLKMIFQDFCNCSNNIILNSLVFDVNELPDAIDKKNIINPLLEQNKLLNEQTKSIRNAVDLNISIMELENKLNTTSKKISDLENIENKEEIFKVLTDIKEDIELLKYLSLEHNKFISENDPTLSVEKIEEEKTLCLLREKNFDFFSGID